MHEFGGKLYYDWNDHNSDIEQITHMDFNYKHIISIYRGSLVIGTHLSNIDNIPLSIIQFQTRDGNDKKPKFLLNLLPQDKEVDVLVIDDIVDSGKTMNVIKEFLIDLYPKCNFRFQTIFGNKGKNNDVEYLREQYGKWVVFPWEI